MDSHSRSASPRDLTATRPQHRPPSPPPTTPPAFDNRAYQHDEDHNHNDSFTSQHQNGHTKDQPNGTQTKTPEAVNLELINLTPKNGSKKKDVEVDMNASNPYDEYFVPVNEHRKYMRGEKLYVTADKRGEKGGCKRPLCWTLLALVAAVVIALIVLAATGILFTNAPTPLDQFNSSSVSSARAFGGLGSHDHSPDLDHDHSTHMHDDQDQIDHDQDHVGQEQDQSHHQTDHSLPEAVPTPEPAPKEHAETTTQKLHLPLSDESSDVAMYVPRTVEGELKIDNEEFSVELLDPESEEFREFNNNFGNAMKKALFDKETLANNKIAVEVVAVRPGSLLVTYRIHWTPKTSSEVIEELLTANSLKTSLDSYLDRNSRMISVYHVAEDKMSTRQVLDVCHWNKNNCEYGCAFDETTLDFMCTCPRGQILDMVNSKKCMSILESQMDLETAKPVEDTKQKEFRVLDIGNEGTTTKHSPIEEKPKEHFDWKSSEEVVPETTTNAETELKHSHVFGQHSEEVSKHEPTAEPEPISEPEPTAQPEPVGSKDLPELEPTSQPEPKPTTQPEPEPTTQPEPEPTAQPEPEPSVKLEPEPSAKPEPEPAVLLESNTESEPSAEPEPTTLPEPSPELDSFTELKSTPADSNMQLIFEPKFEREERPIDEQKVEQESTTEPQSKSENAVELQTKPDPTAEPEPTSEPEPTVEPQPSEKHKSSSDIILTNKQFDGSTSEPEIATKAKPLWEYRPVTERDSFERDAEMESEFKTTVKSETKLDSTTESGTTTEHAKVTSLLDHLHTNESKTLNEITTTATSVFENEKTEPEETRPDVFSIYERLNNEEKASNHFLSQSSEQELKDSEDNHQHTNVKNYMDIFNENMDTETQKRYFKQTETTTASIEAVVTSTSLATSKSTEPDEDISFDLLTKRDENPEIKPAAAEENAKENERQSLNPIEFVEVEHTTTISSEPTTVSTEPEEEQQTYNITRTINPTINMTSINNSEMDRNISDTKGFENNINIKNETQIESEFNKAFGTAIDEATSLNTTSMAPVQEITTMANERTSSTEYSISKDYKPNNMHGIMEFLENKTKTTEATTITSTEKTTTEAKEITFDAINSFFNRSSKSINEDAEGIKNSTVETTTEAKITTTVSDWLSENVSEINYKDMNMDPKKEKHTTTEQSITKIEEIMNKGYNKDDFEPEYLNINPSKGPEQEVPFYGMVHSDYDSEDPRVKRVNSVKENPVLIINKMSGEVNNSETHKSEMPVSLNDMENPSANVTSETIDRSGDVTVISLEKPTDKIEVVIQNSQPVTNVNTTIATTEVSSTNQHNQDTNDEVESTTVSQYIYKSVEKMGDEPAPVWEKEDEQTNQPNLTAVTSGKNITFSEQDNKETFTNNHTEEEFQNRSVTQVNNLNVTIYEVPGLNHSSSTSKSSAHSSEYEDHETEMNPFLPEVENNKSLVKKLQEGHDIIEAANVNETQNENLEEHSTHSSVPSSSEASTTTEANIERTSRTNEDESTFNELTNENYNSPEEDANAETNSKSENAEEKSLPVSTFLQDTDDLDTKKELTTESPEHMSSVDLQTAAPVVSKVTVDEDGDYLSVVPIEEEKRDEKESLRKTYINGSIQKLNDISDSPKKSDRRTFDASKLDSVINNEA